jgi:hypothetical protein
VRRAPLEDLRGCGDPVEPGIETSLTITSADRQLLGGEHQRRPSCTSPTIAKSGLSSTARSAAVSAVSWQFCKSTE